MSAVPAALAERIAAIECEHPVRVAIDGVDGAGKTTLADRLAPLVVAAGRPVIRASVDHFQRPRGERYARGRHSPEGYYRDSFDYAALRRVLLDPLGPGGSRRYRTGVHAHDAPLEVAEEVATPDAVLLVDGVFLQRPELRGLWELVVFVDTDPEVALSRALARDGEDERPLYEQRYVPGQQLYFAEAAPRERADVVIAA